MSAVIINSYAGAGQYSRTPLEMQESVPAGMPILIHDAMFGPAPHSDALFANMQANGGDMSVHTDSTMTEGNRLPLQITTLDTGTNTLIAWTVNGSAMSALDKLYIKTHGSGGSLTQPAASAQYGSREVWDGTVGEAFGLVSHDLATNEVDGSLFTVTGTAAITALNGLPGKGFGPTHGVGTTDKVATGYTADPEKLIWSLLARRSGNGGGGFGRMLVKDKLTLACNNPSSRHLVERNFATTNGNWGPAQLTVNIWTHVMVYQNGAAGTNKPVFYHDGSSQSLGSDNDGSGLRTSDTNALLIGNRSDNVRHYDGQMSEVRARHATLTSAWATAESSNLNDPANFANAEALVTV